MILTFSFLIFSDTIPEASVTERNTLASMVVYAGEPYTPHEYHHFDRIFSIKWENGLVRRQSKCIVVLGATKGQPRPQYFDSRLQGTSSINQSPF